MANSGGDEAAMGCLGHSRISDVKETEMDVKVVNEGDECETSGPSQATPKGQPVLEPATFHFGRSSVIEEDLDDLLGEVC